MVPTRTSFRAARSLLLPLRCPLPDTRCSVLICCRLMLADRLLFYVARYSLISTRLSTFAAICCSLLSSRCLQLLPRYTLLTALLAARFLLPADRRTLLSNCCCSLCAIQRSSLLIFVARRLLHAVRSKLLGFCSRQLATHCSLFVVRCPLVAARFSLWFLLFAV